MTAEAQVAFVPGVGWKWSVVDGGDVLYASADGYASDTEAAAVASDTLGTEWPGSETDKSWHYVGDTGEPAFENGWSNLASGKYQLGFRIREAGTVDIQGEITGGTITDAVFTLPAAYRPIDTAYAGGFWRTGTATVDQEIGAIEVRIQDTGSVVVFCDTAVTPDSVVITGQFYLTPPTGP